MAKGSLKKSIEEGRYAGVESLPMSKELLAHLGVQFSISCEEDLQEFKLLSPEEIGGLLQDKRIKEEFAAQLKKDNQLIGFFFDISLERLRVVLSAIVLHSDMAGRLDSLANPHFLGEDRHRLVIQSFLEKIDSAETFSRVFEKISERRRTEFFNELTIEGVLRFIDSAESFKDVFEFLPTELRQNLFLRLTEERFLGFIQSAQNFNHVFKVLDDKQKVEFLKKLTFEKVVGFIQSSDDLSAVLQFLDQGKRCEVLKILKVDGVLRFINSVKIFKQMGETPSWEGWQDLLLKLTKENHIFDLIQSAQDFNHVFKVLDNAHRVGFFDKLTLEKVVGFINSPKDLIHILQFLGESESAKIINKLARDGIARVINSEQAFREIFRESFCPHSSQRQIVDALGFEKLANFINTVGDLKYFFNDLLGKYSERQQLLEKFRSETLKSFIRVSDVSDGVFYPFVLEAFLKKINISELCQFLELPPVVDVSLDSNVFESFRNRSSQAAAVLKAISDSTPFAQRMLPALKNIAWRSYICNGDLEGAKKLFNLEPERSLTEALRLAVIHGKDEIYAWLLGQYKNKNGDLNAADIFGAKVRWSSETSDLLEAIKGGHFKIVEKILSMVNPPPNEDYFHDVLLEAVKHNALEVVWGVLLKISNDHRDLSLIQILKNDWDRSRGYEYFLKIAIEQNRADIVSILLAPFQDAEKPPLFLENSLLLAVKNKNQEMVRLLAPYSSADLKEAFAQAIIAEDSGMVAALLSVWSLEKKLYGVDNLLVQAVKIDAADILKLLLSAADVSSLEWPMQEAVKNNKGAMVDMLFAFYLQTCGREPGYHPGRWLVAAAEKQNFYAFDIFIPYVHVYAVIDVLKKFFASGRQEVVDRCVTFLGCQQISEHIPNKDAFIEMFKCLNAQWRSDVFNQLGAAKVSRFVSNVSEWREVKQFLTDAQCRAVLQNKKYLNSMINSASDLAEFSQYLSDEQKAELLAGLGVQKLAGFVDSFAALEQCCSIFPSNATGPDDNSRRSFLGALGSKKFFDLLSSAQDLGKIFVTIKSGLELLLSMDRGWQDGCSQFLKRIEPSVESLLSLPHPLYHEVRPFLLRTLTGAAADIKDSFDRLLEQALEHKRGTKNSVAGFFSNKAADQPMSDRLISGLCVVAEKNLDFKNNLVVGLGLQVGQDIQAALKTYRGQYRSQPRLGV